MDPVAQNVFFYAIALGMVVAALRVVTTRNIVHAALWLVLVLAGTAAQFVLLIAEFTAITQVLVYIGAIIVLFLFGIMLTRAPVGNSLEVDRNQILMGLAVAVPLLALLGWTLWDSYSDTEVDLEVAAAASGASNTAVVSDSIFSAFIVPFEAVSVLLLAALVGAVVLARKE